MWITSNLGHLAEIRNYRTSEPQRVDCNLEKGANPICENPKLKGRAITSRCSCPLKGRVDRRMQSGNSMQRRVDAAGQLNSML